MRAVDVHGFAGGFTLGVVRRGFDLVGKHEGLEGFGAPLCEGNRHLLGDDWRGQYAPPSEWAPLASGVNLVFGNPPCSGFSGRSNTAFRGVDSKINHCMWDFTSIAARYAPELAIFESVQPAYKIGRPLMRQLRAKMEADTGMRYDLHHVLHSAIAVGGHAVRRRYFWVVSRVPFGVELPAADTPRLTTAELLTGLPDEETGWDGEPDGHLILPAPAGGRLRDLAVQAGNDRWSQGERSALVARRLLEEDGRLPDSWYRGGVIPPNYLAVHSFNAWRLHGDRPPPVIDGGAMGGRIHPTALRPLTFRDCARLMGFPDDWTVKPAQKRPASSSSWFGKGITVGCGEWIAGWAARALEGRPGTIKGEPDGEEREWKIDVTHAHKLAASAAS